MGMGGWGREGARALQKKAWPPGLKVFGTAGWIGFCGGGWGVVCETKREIPVIEGTSGLFLDSNSTVCRYIYEGLGARVKSVTTTNAVRLTELRLSNGFFSARKTLL